MKNCYYEGAVPFFSENLPTPPTPSPLKAVGLKIGFSTRKRAFFTIVPHKKTGPGRAEFSLGAKCTQKKTVFTIVRCHFLVRPIRPHPPLKSGLKMSFSRKKRYFFGVRESRRTKEGGGISQETATTGGGVLGGPQPQGGGGNSRGTHPTPL